MQVLPVVIGPESLPHFFLGEQQFAVGRVGLSDEVFRTAVFDDASGVYDQHARERQGFSDIMSNAEQGCITPVFANATHKISALLAIEAAERLVQNGKPDATFMHRASEPNALSFAARDQPAALSKVPFADQPAAFSKAHATPQI